MIRLVADIPLEAREWRNHKFVQRWCRQYTLIDEKSHAQWLERISNDPTIKMYGIAHVKETGVPKHPYNPIFPNYLTQEEFTPVGVCGLTSINRVNQSAEFSLYIAPMFQRQGFGEKALRLLLDHGFKSHNLNRIWGETFDGNPAAKTFEKLGMKKEGTLRSSYFRDGKFIDSHIYAILRSEWNG